MNYSPTYMSLPQSTINDERKHIGLKTLKVLNYRKLARTFENLTTFVKTSPQYPEPKDLE